MPSKKLMDLVNCYLVNFFLQKLFFTRFNYRPGLFFLGGGRLEGVGGAVRPRGGGVPKVGGFVHDPLLPHAKIKGGCVSGGLGVQRYVCDNSVFSSLPRRKS